MLTDEKRWELIRQLQAYRNTNAWLHTRIQEHRLSEYAMASAIDDIRNYKRWYVSLMRQLHGR